MCGMGGEIVDGLVLQLGRVVVVDILFILCHLLGRRSVLAQPEALLDVISTNLHETLAVFILLLTQPFGEGVGLTGPGWSVFSRLPERGAEGDKPSTALADTCQSGSAHFD